MYRVFEALDEMVQTVEQAYGVPMTANCMVPRNEMLALLDDLRNALPVEVDDAQDVLDQRDEIIRGAEDRARLIVEDANAEAHETVTRAREDADAMVADAENRAHTLVAKAEDEAAHLVDTAHRDATAMVDRASAEAARLEAKGNESYQRAVDEGLAEQHRLVSESEVVRRANEEAHRVVDAAHTDSNRLRSECDAYVDGKLAEFEESLSATLRAVSRDRSAIRRGAGATGASSGGRTHTPADSHDYGE
ncbi:SPFH domain-containing protein [Corynebacterium epidermidicanis]|uniref:Cell division initiation protein n=1 Tax=Corynebacterium epidermidicanis TaxID=1050174 RepID=A0A0G3GQP1_9CORY|nr:DivIVA domain-containing protein [Corynebacterium epidermidicanis]AKK03454.1 cell division initiation protein [Corynebacterium epidermidicanis]